MYLLCQGEAQLCEPIHLCTNLQVENHTTSSHCLIPSLPSSAAALAFLLVQGPVLLKGFEHVLLGRSQIYAKNKIYLRI